MLVADAMVERYSIIADVALAFKAVLIQYFQAHLGRKTAMLKAICNASHICA